MSTPEYPVLQQLVDCVGGWEVSPKHTGWRRTARVTVWKGKRVYVNLADYNRRNQFVGKASGYYDLERGRWVGPPTVRQSAFEIVEGRARRIG